MPKTPATRRSQRPKAFTVFAAAFLAGAVAAVGINRVLDVHIAQAKPQVECEPIFVALRDLAQGSPVTIWDVALRDWPKAMLPTTALRAHDRFEGMLVKHPVREGQPLLSVQLVAAAANAAAPEVAEQAVETYAARTFEPAGQPDADLWAASDQPAQAPQAATEPVVTSVDVAPVELVAGPPAADATATVPAPNSPPSDRTADDEATPTEVAVAVPAPVISEPSFDAVTTTADMPPLMPTDERTTIESVAPSATAAAAQPKTPVEPNEPIFQADTPAQPALTPAQPVVAAPRRYLVVPERIAVQAEASFTSPAPQIAAVKPQGATSTVPVESTPAQPAAADVTKQAPIRDKPTAPVKRPTSTATARSKSVPRVSQAPTLETHPNTEPQQPVSAFDGLFPNLRATIGAVDEELQKIRREQTAPEQGSQRSVQPQQQRPQTAKQPSRTARWPWSFGR